MDFFFRPNAALLAGIAACSLLFASPFASAAQPGHGIEIIDRATNGPSVEEITMSLEHSASELLEGMEAVMEYGGAAAIRGVLVGLARAQAAAAALPGALENAFGQMGRNMALLAQAVAAVSHAAIGAAGEAVDSWAVSGAEAAVAGLDGAGQTVGFLVGVASAAKDDFFHDAAFGRQAFSAAVAPAAAGMARTGVSALANQMIGGLYQVGKVVAGPITVVWNELR